MGRENRDSPSDVNYTTVVDNVAWVLDGSTAYFIVNLVNGMVYDLEVRVKKGIRTIDFNQFEMLTVNGHMAGLRRKEVRRGFRREPMKQLIVVIPCEKTLRTLELVLTGKDPEQLEKLKDTLSDSRCH